MSKIDSNGIVDLRRFHFQLSIHFKKFLLLITLYFTLIIKFYAQDIKLIKDYEWYFKGYLILDPSFAHNSSEIVFSKQFYIPDGGDAFGRDKYVESLLLKAKTQKRFADPVITILNLRTGKCTPIDYGWNPDCSKDDQSIIYVYQKLPISGYRVLAKTMAGNSIKLYDRRNHKMETIAEPEDAFLMEPDFIDSTKIYYMVGEAVNGAYGGGAGLTLVDIKTKNSTVILEAKKQFGYYGMVGRLRKLGNSLAYTYMEPLDSGINYRYCLMRLGKIMLDFGINYMDEFENKVAIDKQYNILYLDDNIQMITDPKFLKTYDSSGHLLSKKKIWFKYDKAYLSPNGNYVVFDDDKSNFYLLNLKISKKVKLPIRDMEIHSISWSEDCKKIAIVQNHESIEDTDKLIVFEIIE